MISVEGLHALKKIELIQSILLCLLGLFFFFPVINNPEQACLIVGIYFLVLGLIAIGRGKKYNRDENVFQVTVTGGSIFLVFSIIIFFLSQVAPTLVSIVLGSFIIVCVIYRGFFYIELLKLENQIFYNLVFASLGIIFLFLPVDFFSIIKIFFSVTMITMGISNYFFVIGQIREKIQEN
ncbi:hypothetical protein [Vagococcus xieshaowenii]|uniref:Uncharacterized protein n=1 Tax=Vagococcus xieshaowenii TaxID=2562451 RepID=A0AAJ5EEZ9_9ENTE|nr:hypothetical protein [Vagococcus xieshaowenii]QCA29146.1 hypothetical protein E4Z98_07395 [Vagococcus xieshaowenii]TFZ40877.1 hypothetical protein E4031_05700 [Vagococcus xieshaowenii]